LTTLFYFFMYLFAVVLVYVLTPVFIFEKSNESFSDVIFSNYIRMTLLVIAVGYILTITKLFEFISIIIVFLFFILRKYFFKKSKIMRIKTSKEIQLWTFDFLEGIVNLPRLFVENVKAKYKELRDREQPSKLATIVTTLVAITVIAGVIWIRIYDSFVHAAPAMSDAYVTLAWMKYINDGNLFHDGIYPQGYYIYQAVAQKFSGIDHIYVLKFTGPLSSALIAASIYFAVTGFLKNRYAGIAAAAGYGVFGFLYTGSWERQAATNSQEFAFLFIFPCLYYLYRYIKQKNKQDLWIAFSALCVIGLLHSFAFAYAALGIAMLGISTLLTDFKGFKFAVIPIFVSGVLAVVTAFVPIAIGLLKGKSFHSASADFFVASGFEASYPNLITTDYIAVAGIAICILLFLVNIKKENSTAFLFFGLFGASTGALYYYGGVLTSSLLISARSRELFSLISPIMTAICIYGILMLFKKIDKRKLISSFAIAILLISLLYLHKPEPIIPYKMEYDSPVEQYLAISRKFRPTEWLIVSNEEGYAMAYGKGWHLMVKDLLEGFKFSKPSLDEDGILIGGIDEDITINVPHVFIFFEKKTHETYSIMKELEDIYARRQNERILLRNWIDNYKQNYDTISLFYEDDVLEVYYIYQPEVYEQINEKVLGPK